MSAYRSPDAPTEGTRPGAAVDLAAAAYRLLLRAYPAAFRAAYEREMMQLFRDQLHDHRHAMDAGAGADARSRTMVGFWTAALWDVARSAPALRLDALRIRWQVRGRSGRVGPWNGDTHPHLVGGTMRTKRTMAVLAVLGGAFEVAHAISDVLAYEDVQVYASVIQDGSFMLAVTLNLLMGALLATSGVALFRRGTDAMRVARVAALACLVLVVGVQLTFPFMSIFARLLGMGIPIALLLVTRRPDSSLPAVA